MILIGYKMTKGVENNIFLVYLGFNLYYEKTIHSLHSCLNDNIFGF
jgi:hypothetical protein